MTDIKQELAKVIELHEDNTPIVEPFNHHVWAQSIAQAILSSGLVVGVGSVKELVDALKYAIRFAKPEDMDRDYLKDVLARYQGETK